MPIPDTLYAKAGDAAVAYQVFGSGEHRAVALTAHPTNVELFWEWAPFHHWFERVGSFATGAWFDQRGTGCSDRIPGAASVEERMEDVRVVMDAVGWERATIYGFADGGPLGCLFAATYPERTERLILQNSFARWWRRRRRWPRCRWRGDPGIDVLGRSASWCACQRGWLLPGRRAAARRRRAQR
jgi:pimeloyl-ACP methyl ester carboxylesterase